MALNQTTSSPLSPEDAALRAKGPPVAGSTFVPSHIQYANEHQGGNQFVKGYWTDPSVTGGGGFLGQVADSVSGGLQHVSDVVSNDPIAKTIAAVGLAVATGGASSAISGALLDSGIISSAAVADAASSAIINAGVQIAQGVPPGQALTNAAVTFGAGQYINPAISSEIKSVISSPTIANMATNAATSIATGALRGQSGDTLLKSAIGAATGSLAGSVSKEVGQTVLNNIDDPTIAKIASDAAAAGTKAALTNQNVGKAALDAGATTLANSNLGIDNPLSGITSNLPSIDMSGFKAAIKPISDAATKFAQPISDAATTALQPVSDAVAKATSNLPTVNAPNLNLPNVDLSGVTGGLPTTSTAGTADTSAPPAVVPGQAMHLGKVGSDMTEHQLQQLYESLTAAPTENYNYDNSAPQSVDVAKMEAQPFMQPQQQMYFSKTGGPVQHFNTGAQPDPAQSDYTQGFSNITDLAKSLQTAADAGTISKIYPHKMMINGNVGVSQYTPKVLPQLAAVLRARGMTLADGGQPNDHEHPNYDGTPVFRTGGLEGLGGKYVEGKGDGTSDDITAMLANGEYVFSADVVSALGNGSNKAGAERLNQMVHAIRARARSAPPDKLPPDAKSPLEYLKSSKGKKNG